MSELKIIETVGDSPNAEFGKWYGEKIRETAKFFVRNMDPGYSATPKDTKMPVGLRRNSGMMIREKEPVAQ